MDFQMVVLRKKIVSRRLVLAADVGGTKTLIGIFSESKNHPELVALFRFESRQTKSFSDPVNFVLEFARKNYGIPIKDACIGVAAVISENNDYAKTTKLKWDVEKKELYRKTSLKKIMLVNDFEAMGYFVNAAAKEDISQIKRGSKITGKNILVIGAGTGLGKCSLFYDNSKKIYVPMPSEAGHADFAPLDSLEFGLMEFIKRKNSAKSVTYDDILSGSGVEDIFLFLLKTSKKYSSTAKEILKSKNKAELISKHRKSDMTCRKTFNLFAKVYARFAKSCSLDLLAYSGVYISGGIAQKNPDIFNSDFIKEFQKVPNLQFVLNQIPVYLITNKNAGLIGAAFLALRQK